MREPGYVKTRADKYHDVRRSPSTPSDTQVPRRFTDAKYHTETPSTSKREDAKTVSGFTKYRYRWLEHLRNVYRYHRKNRYRQVRRCKYLSKTCTTTVAEIVRTSTVDPRACVNDYFHYRRRENAYFPLRT